VAAIHPKLLIVDDERVIVEILAETVMHCGYEIRVACGGEEAVAEAKDFRPDCVMTGIMMPKMDGFELARLILEFLPGCKFVVVSSNAHMQECKDAHAVLGFDPRLLLAKPFTRAEIFDALYLAGFPCTKQKSD
jgi:two-component system, response regulator YesN